MTYLSKKYGDRYTVISAAGFLCVQEPRPVALKRLQDAGVDESILDVSPNPPAWRAMFITATAAEANAATTALQQAASQSDLDKTSRKAERLERLVVELGEALAATNRETSIEKLRQQLNDQYAALVERYGQEPDSVASAMFWNHLHSTAAGRRLAELEAG